MVSAGAIREQTQKLLEQTDAVDEDIDDVLVDYLEGVFAELLSANNHAPTALDTEEICSVLETIEGFLPKTAQIPLERRQLWFTSTLLRLEKEKTIASPVETENRLFEKLDLTCQISTCSSQPSGNSKTFTTVDKSLKETIVARHSMVVDSAEGGSSAPKLLGKPTQEKSKTRYLDGKIVSTKGQRFVDIKPPDSEELKNTYINLKPMRKYRFH